MTSLLTTMIGSPHRSIVRATPSLHLHRHPSCHSSITPTTSSGQDFHLPIRFTSPVSVTIVTCTTDSSSARFVLTIIHKRLLNQKTLLRLADGLFLSALELRRSVRPQCHQPRTRTPLLPTQASATAKPRDTQPWFVISAAISAAASSATRLDF